MNGTSPLNLTRAHRWQLLDISRQMDHDVTFQWIQWHRRGPENQMARDLEISTHTPTRLFPEDTLMKTYGTAPTEATDHLREASVSTGADTIRAMTAITTRHVPTSLATKTTKTKNEIHWETREDWPTADILQIIIGREVATMTTCTPTAHPSRRRCRSRRGCGA